MESNEFREKLHSYHGHIDSPTFINAFIDAHRQHGDNLELILEEIEKSKIKYQKRIEEYRISI